MTTLLLRAARRAGFGDGPPFAWLLVALFAGMGFLVSRSGAQELPMRHVAVTIVPSDAGHLACSWGDEAGGQRCEFDAAGQPQQSAQAQPLMPVLTLDRELLLVSGLFSSQAVTEKLAQPGVVASDQRMTVHCSVTTLAHPRDVRTRFRRDAAWSAPETARVIQVVGCRVE
jgi:hypothetical protein